MKLSDKLITLRKENGWSQEDFAEKLDVSRQAISRWENGTALPDAQNILQISKLFNVTADYLLNDDYNEEANIPAVQISAGEVKPLTRKKKYLHWLSICFIILLSACAIIAVLHQGPHAHPELTRVVENEIAPTCTVEGSYEIVLYCTECGKELSRIRISKGMPSHQFENEKCIVCGEDQRERNN
ncbi:MAG: helix-turn-helix transcriptional regulator [Clostridia bacterium]|nr:helix-turn-helix transcriptional regulator [Clostridia bacterium]